MVVAANSNQLISITELLTLNNSDITSNVSSITDADYQNTLINQASDFIENFCNRVFIEATYTEEVYDGDNSQYLYLRQFPVDTASTFTLVAWDTFNDAVLQTFEINTEYLISRSKIGEIFKRGFFWKGVNNFRVTYTAGYTLALVPYDLKNACAKLAAMPFFQSGKVGVGAERIGSYSVTYDKSEISLMFAGIPVPLEISGVLDSYRRVNV